MVIFSFTHNVGSSDFPPHNVVAIAPRPLVMLEIQKIKIIML
jgi:hypothetical protein